MLVLRTLGMGIWVTSHCDTLKPHHDNATLSGVTYALVRRSYQVLNSVRVVYK